jgi:hypothetical protein
MHQFINAAAFSIGASGAPGEEDIAGVIVARIAAL